MVPDCPTLEYYASANARRFGSKYKCGNPKYYHNKTHTHIEKPRHRSSTKILPKNVLLLPISFPFRKSNSSYRFSG
jgi:hypothetical protein